MKKKILCVFTMAMMFNMCVITPSAAGLTAYSGYVQKTQDIVTPAIRKETTSVATNWVEYVEGNRKLTCWIQEAGSKISATKTYTDSGYQKLNYNDASSTKGKDVSLAVSTALTTIQKTYSFGSWSPDDVN